jgi:2',3'-cyclic-nucleotide 2'-phosphodiesterase (5'-nucleotidase family)
MKILTFILFSSQVFLSLFAQPVSDLAGQEENFKRSNHNNFPATSWNPVIGSSNTNIISLNDSHSPMNNFICDVMLDRANADFSFINFGDITACLYAGEITELDLYALCPINRTLVILEVNGTFLLEFVEKSISGFRNGLAIGGGKIEYNSERPNGNRLTYFQVGNYPVYPQKEYRVVTTDYLVDEHAGFSTLFTIDSTKIFRTEILLRTAVKQYIEKHTPLGPASVQLDKRWIKKP